MLFLAVSLLFFRFLSLDLLLFCVSVFSFPLSFYFGFSFWLQPSVWSSPWLSFFYDLCSSPLLLHLLLSSGSPLLAFFLLSLNSLLLAFPLVCRDHNMTVSDPLFQVKGRFFAGVAVLSFLCLAMLLWVEEAFHQRFHLNLDTLFIPFLCCSVLLLLISTVLLFTSMGQSILPFLVFLSSVYSHFCDLTTVLFLILWSFVSWLELPLVTLLAIVVMFR